MILQNLSILNFKNIQEANLGFADKLNCFVGLNGQGKTNLLDAIYYLSFTKSAFNPIDSQNITHNEDFCMVQGEYTKSSRTDEDEQVVVTCGLRRGLKKQFRIGKNDYQRLQDHIGVIALVMASPTDQDILLGGSEERRKFVDGVISQTNRRYLENLTHYQSLLKQRNAVLKQYEEYPDELPAELLDVVEEQMADDAMFIFKERTTFIEQFMPFFRTVYQSISGGAEEPTLNYVSQLQNRDILSAMRDTRRRDLILGWTSQGIHKDDIEFLVDGYPAKQTASQGQQKTCSLSLKLAQALFLGQNKSKQDLPILLLDDIFDKLDAERVERIVKLVLTEGFGQIFVTDTDRQHLSTLLLGQPEAMVFNVKDGQFTVNANIN